MKRLLVCLSLFAALIAVSGCHRQPPAPPQWKLGLTTSPAVPQAMHDTVFTLHVLRPNGQPAAGGAAQLTLHMSFMDMPDITVPLTDQGQGNYTGKGQFSMNGDWDCHATVSIGGQRLSQRFHYKIG